MDQSTDKNRKPLLFLLGFIVFILTATSITFSAMLSSAGDKMDQLNKKSTALKQEIEMLERSTVQIVALTDLATQAEKLGYSKNVDITELRLQKPLAYITP